MILNRIRWFMMSRYKKLLYQIECAKKNKQRLHLKNGIVLDFSNGNWNECSQKYPYGELGKYYLITRKFPTGNRKMELIKCNRENMWLPEFTTHIMKLDIEPCERN